MAYVGARQGDFWVTGQVSRIRYHITARGEFLIDDAGRLGVDQRDVKAFTSMNRGRNFKVVQPPAPPPPVPVPQAVPEKSEAWKPVAMERTGAAHEWADGTPGKWWPLSPAEYTVKEIKTLEERLTLEQATWMLEEERDDKNRVGAIRFLERIANEA